MERVVTIPIYETREIEPYPSCEGRWYKECEEPKLKKKKKEYPKTYEECCKILGYSGNYNLILTTDVDNKLFNTLYRLKVCRDAYWKIAGDEMGLGRPWEPNWKNDEQFKYVIICRRGCIIKDTYTAKDVILSFPTEEMRDAFKKNFDPDIEICKELL